MCIVRSDTTLHTCPHDQLDNWPFRDHTYAIPASTHSQYLPESIRHVLILNSLSFELKSMHEFYETCVGHMLGTVHVCVWFIHAYCMCVCVRVYLYRCLHSVCMCVYSCMQVYVCVYVCACSDAVA